MQKIVLLVLLLLGIGLIVNKTINSETKVQSDRNTQESNKSQLISPTRNPENNVPVTDVSSSVFVPYWSVQNLEGVEEYDSSIYFGISVTKNGVNKEDQGFANISKYIQNTSNSKRYITVRMLDTETNLAILEDSKAQEKVITDVIEVTKEYGFDGVVLDLELSVIPFTNVKEEISTFMSRFSEKLKNENISFNITLYGDTYYRSRPYDVKKIGSYVDSIYIMAYDFHKSRGEPGPNFPFQGKETYGYDFQQMIHDFSNDVPPEKLSVIFGMYGYDWTLGSGGKPLTGAIAFTLADAQDGFVPNCDYNSCSSQRDSVSKEMNVKYKDEDGYNHSAWFEDDESVQIKTDYLMEQGIGNVSYWTWGYW